MEKQREFASIGAAKTNSLPPKKDAIYIAICLAIVAGAFLLVWPAGDIAFGDDVAYSRMALRLAETGHLMLNGWEAAMNLQHAYWGALVIKLFGFSPFYLRVSTIPFALGAVALSYLLGRNAGLKNSAAALVALTLGLSPIFVPFALSYMTDVPGLFFFLVSLYALSRAFESPDGWQGYVWMAAGTSAGLVGGTGRQMVWFVPLLVLPYLGWVRRRNVRFAASCLAAWALSVSCVAGVTFWFNHQNYVVPLPSLFSELRMAASRPAAETEIFSRILLMLLLMCLPTAVPLAVRLA